MLRFLAACLDPPADPPGPALAFACRSQARLGPGMNIGLCWLIIARRNTAPVVWHNGGTWGFRSFAGVAPATSTAAIVLTNTARSVDKLGLDLLEGPAPRRAVDASASG